MGEHYGLAIAMALVECFQRGFACWLCNEGRQRNVGPVGRTTRGSGRRRREAVLDGVVMGWKGREGTARGDLSRG